jgi:hypothetical protein
MARVAVKDLLAHLHGWHLPHFDWQRRSRAGEPVALPAPGYRWNETPRLNAELWHRYGTCRWRRRPRSTEWAAGRGEQV